MSDTKSVVQWLGKEEGDVGQRFRFFPQRRTNAARGVVTPRRARSPARPLPTARAPAVADYRVVMSNRFVIWSGRTTLAQAKVVLRNKALMLNRIVEVGCIRLQLFDNQNQTVASSEC